MGKLDTNVSNVVLLRPLASTGGDDDMSGSDSDDSDEDVRYMAKEEGRRTVRVVSRITPEQAADFTSIAGASRSPSSQILQTIVAFLIDKGHQGLALPIAGAAGLVSKNAGEILALVFGKYGVHDPKLLSLAKEMVADAQSVVDLLEQVKRPEPKGRKKKG